MMLIINDTVASGAQWSGGAGVFAAVAGSWSSGTVKLQFMGPDGSTWVDFGTATTLTANGGGVFTLPAGRIRAAVVGSPTGVYASAELAKG